MKVDISIHVTPGSARRLAIVGCTLFVTGIAAAAVAVPVTFQSKQKLSAADLNANFAALEARVATLEVTGPASAPISDWQAYTPTLTSDKWLPVNNQVTEGFYRRVGDSAEIAIWTHFSGDPGSTASRWVWGLPSGMEIAVETRTYHAGGGAIGDGLAQQTAQVNTGLSIYAHNESAVTAVVFGSQTSILNGRIPFHFGDGGHITMRFTVPIVGWESSALSSQ